MTAVLRSLPRSAPAESCDQDVVTLLENMLASARSGKTQGVLVIEVTFDDEEKKETSNTFYQAGYRDRFKTIGHLSRIIHELHTQP